MYTASHHIPTRDAARHRVWSRRRVPNRSRAARPEIEWDVAFILKVLVNAAALWVATRLVPGVTYHGDWAPFLGVAVIFGAVNATIRPLAKVLTLPLIILTLGIFALVVNGLMLLLTSSLSGALGLGFHVSGFWAAFFGALVVSIVSTMLWALAREERR
jgi:putative membrane protein